MLPIDVNEETLHAETNGSELSKYNGANRREVLWGGGGADKLYGSSINDLLIGGQGDDHLHGGRGINELFGGADFDTYYIGQYKDDTINKTQRKDFDFIDDSDHNGKVVMFGSSDNDWMPEGVSSFTSEDPDTSILSQENMIK